MLQTKSAKNYLKGILLTGLKLIVSFRMQISRIANALNDGWHLISARSKMAPENGPTFRQRGWENGRCKLKMRKMSRWTQMEESRFSGTQGARLHFRAQLGGLRHN